MITVHLVNGQTHQTHQGTNADCNSTHYALHQSPTVILRFPWHSVRMIEERREE